LDAGEISGDEHLPVGTNRLFDADYPGVGVGAADDRGLKRAGLPEVGHVAAPTCHEAPILLSEDARADPFVAHELLLVSGIFPARLDRVNGPSGSRLRLRSLAPVASRVGPKIVELRRNSQLGFRDFSASRTFVDEAASHGLTIRRGAPSPGMQACGARNALPDAYPGQR
jgi:hypothetical protein